MGNNIEQRDLKQLLLENYLPYSKSVIVDRALPAIDGFKPVQRGILHTMRKLGLLKGDFVKSQKVVGATMSIHPHGDSSIYEAMCMLSTGYDGVNTPYVLSKGAFGKRYSRDLQAAAPRYTEVQMTPICAELFEGVDDGAVELIDNFDETEKIPKLLPVKYPTVLVSPIQGVAVAISSNIPPFSLTKVCKSVQGILRNEIKTPLELSKVLGAPEFTTGGIVHASEKDLEDLCKTGCAKLTLSGSVYLDDPNKRLIIYEIPYNTTAEDIIDAIEDAIKDKKIRSITEVNNEIGLAGLNIIVRIKSGCKARDVLKELEVLTPLRKKISFRTRVIINDRYEELGILDLLRYWIDFRETCIHDLYATKLQSELELEHKLAAWGLIYNDISKVAAMLGSNTEEDAVKILKSTYKLDDIQCNYLLDQMIRRITKDRAAKEMARLQELRNSIAEHQKLVSDKQVRYAQIIKEQQEIIDKYGRDNKTALGEALTDEDYKLEEDEMSDEYVRVVYTRDGFVRKFTSISAFGQQFVAKNGDVEVLHWDLKNNEYILVFDRFGTVHKVLVDTIEASNRAVLTDQLYRLAGLEKKEDVIWADACGDYSKYFNLIYPSGKGVRVYYSKALGKSNRAKYKAGYDKVEVGRYWITTENKFFMMTHRKKATFCNIENLGFGLSNERSAFRLGRVSGGDFYETLYPYKNLPRPDLIDLGKYSKEYAVLMGDDYFFEDPEADKMAQQLIDDRFAEYEENARLAEEKKQERINMLNNRNKKAPTNEESDTGESTDDHEDVKPLPELTEEAEASMDLYRRLQGMNRS